MNSVLIEKIIPSNIQYRNFIFIPVFFTFFIVLDVFRDVTLVLENFNDRSVSVATSEAIDIGLRVATFYKAIVFAIILLFLFFRSAVILSRFVNEKELRMANGLSLAGFCLLFFQLPGADMQPTLYFILAMMAVVASGFIVHRVKKVEDRDFLAAFTWTMCIVTSLFFLQWQLAQFLIGRNIVPLHVFVLVLGIPLYNFFTRGFPLSYRIFKTTRSLLFLPLISFLSIEGSMILNQRGIYFHAEIIYLILLVCILLWSLGMYKKNRFATHNQSFLPEIFQSWIPWLLAGIFCFAFYEPVVTPEIDLFESANKVLPLHQWFEFGKIPFLDSFSSHALSDFGTGLIYSLLNGADPMGLFVYGFLIGVIVLVVVYFFLLKISGNGFFALWLTLAYPFTSYLLPAYFNFVPVTALAFIMIYEKQSVKRYAFFFSSIAFMILWRIDLGSSVLVAAIGSLLFLVLLMPDFRTNRKNLIKGLGITLITILIAFLVSLLIAGPQLFVSLKDALAYLSSFQSYGLKDLAYNHDWKYFSLYYIFPSAILLIFFYIIYSLATRKFSGQYLHYGLAIVFLCIFYFSNLQRGLVRHTLAEQWDNALTSYALFIVCSSVFLALRNKHINTSFLIFFLAATVLVTSYVFAPPSLKTNNYFSIVHAKLNSPYQALYSDIKIKRYKENDEVVGRFSEFNSWMKKSFSDDQTFLDFSNTPMLYYYCNRIVPNYLLQIPHTAHNELLQRRFIDDLPDYKIPVVVLSNVPQNFWDYLDGIPNTLRHYRISEYIYRNYKPAYIMSGHAIWIEKNADVVLNESSLISISPDSLIRNGIALSEERGFVSEKEVGFLSKTLYPSMPFDDKKRYLKTTVYSDQNAKIVFSHGDKGMSGERNRTEINMHSGLNEVFIMIEPAKNQTAVGEIEFEIGRNVHVLFSEITLHSADYYPDKVSTVPSTNSLKWIPYIWGNYDEGKDSIKARVIQKIGTENKLLKANSASRYKFNENFSKESGNYVLLNARGLNEKDVDVILSYGNEDEKNGSFSFRLKGDSVSHDYLVRISSQYNWHSKNNTWLELYAVDKDVEIKQLDLLKGD